MGAGRSQQHWRNSQRALTRLARIGAGDAFQAEAHIGSVRPLDACCLRETASAGAFEVVGVGRTARWRTRHLPATDRLLVGEGGCAYSF